MEIESVVSAIKSRAAGRFTIDMTASVLSSLTDEPREFRSTICRLQRNQPDAGWRTILVAQLRYSTEEVHAAYSWAAQAREQLREPESADLYMFMLFDSIPDEEAARLETDDRFCRKIVMRNAEQASGFLDRTFLASVTPESPSEVINDPLQSALLALSADYPWTAPHLMKWRELLLSGKSGAELARSLDGVIVGSEQLK